MKKGFLLILVCLIVISGCSINDLGKIKIIDDAIDNSKIVILRVVYKSSDNGMANFRALITYSKKIKENEPVITAVNFKINTDRNEIILAPKSYVVTDQQKHELMLANISSKTESYTETDSSFFRWQRGCSYLHRLYHGRGFKPFYGDYRSSKDEYETYLSVIFRNQTLNLRNFQERP